MIKSNAQHPTKVILSRWQNRAIQSHAEPVLTAPVKDYLAEKAKLIVIPVTTKKIFIYHKHTNDLLNDNSRLIRFERWINKKSSTLWEKMNTSPKTVNKRIVSWVNALLDNTPWTENSLKTIPGENYILKRVSNEDKDGKLTEAKLTLKQYLSSNKQFKTAPLPIYYPSRSLTQNAVMSEFKTFYQNGLKYHKKQTWLCVLGIPLTIPVILVPLIPNVPGFYLTYRAYCNFKSFLGAKHLQTIMEKDLPQLQFKDVEGYSEILSGNIATASEKDQPQEQVEKLLLNNDLIARIIDHLEIHEIESDLKKALRQELKRLKAEKDV